MLRANCKRSNIAHIALNVRAHLLEKIEKIEKKLHFGCGP